ncbi:MAG TPA: substrate-binding domain-containing protein [Roseiarcus sp.]
MAFRNLLKSAAAVACLGVLAAAVGLAPARADDKISIIMGGGPLWDPFFGAMKKGADDAAKNLGVDYQWVTGTDPNNWMADYAKLLKQSASRHPSALVIGNYFPDSFDPIIRDITASGIPVIISFAGGASWKEDGALGFVGVSGRDLGKSVAELQINAGAKHALCFNHVPANSTLEQMCAGYMDAFKLVAAYQYVKYGMLPAGQILTGPLVITKDNVDQVLKISKEYPGVRGGVLSRGFTYLFWL